MIGAEAVPCLILFPQLFSALVPSLAPCRLSSSITNGGMANRPELQRHNPYFHVLLFIPRRRRQQQYLKIPASSARADEWGWLDILVCWLPHHLGRDVLGGDATRVACWWPRWPGRDPGWPLASSAHSQVIEPWPERAIDHMSRLPRHATSP